MKKPIFTDKAPLAIGPYSQAIQWGDVVFISGQIPLIPATGELNNASVEDEVVQVFNNIEAVLSDNNKSLKDVKKFTVFLTDLSYTPLINSEIEKRINGEYPARSTIQVAGLPMGARVEIECLG